ncbi:MAG: ABC transporter substrate-binding protein [Flavobacterium sp.]|nr:MAG: ABC transporter substrate-binding protein [Flavobacterium sp.]
MEKIKIAGVPEHFNQPWKMAIDAGAFLSEEIDLEWTNVPEGTGKMCEMLRSGQADIAVILTEGIVRDIVNGNPSRIVQEYVSSPLLWGIHVAEKSNYQTLSDLENKTVAISRPGSGSQLMAYVNAKNQNWDTSSLKFEIVNTIDGAVDALSTGNADYFMWEHFMTKPLVDRAIFRRVADCPTPWPCFVIAARNELIEKQDNTLKKVLQIINKQTNSFKSLPGISALLADEFHQKHADIEEWLKITTWSQSPLQESVLNNVQNQLLELSLIDKMGTFAEIATAL